MRQSLRGVALVAIFASCAAHGIQNALFSTGLARGMNPLAIGAFAHAKDKCAAHVVIGEERNVEIGNRCAAALRLRGGSAPAANFEEVGKAFVQHYYRIFDTDRSGLQNLYQDMSMMTFEGEQFQGAQAIAQKLVSLPFQTVSHEVVTADSQPTAGGGVLVFVCGNLKVDGSENQMKFSQVFCLMPLPNAQGFFCYNDVFRLNYG